MQCFVWAGTGCCALRFTLLSLAVLSIACGWCIYGANVGTNISNAGQAPGSAGLIPFLYLFKFFLAWALRAENQCEA